MSKYKVSSTNHKGSKRKSPKRKSSKRRSSKRRSSKRRSPKRRGSKRKSPKRKSPNRKPLPLRRKILAQKNNKTTQWFIITKEGCKFCDEAKLLLNKHKLKYSERKLTEENKDIIYKNIDSLTTKNKKPYRYVPIIFHKGVFIGGYAELKKNLAN